MSSVFGYGERVAVSDVDLSELSVFARETVVAAGDVTLPYFRSNVEVENKRSDGFDPVTEADKAAEMIIRQRIADRFPQHGIYGEEFGHQEGNGLTWVIDPIDGTRAFMSGMLHWGVLLGLFDGETAIVGAMCQPFVGEVFVGDGRQAEYTRGAVVQKLATSSTQSLGDAVLGTTGPDWFGDDRQRFDALRDQVKMYRLGGDCYLHAMVAMGGVDIASDGNLNPYDIQALIPIVRGAGGVVSTYDGGEPSMGGSILCSANQRLHNEALDVIQKIG